MLGKMSITNLVIGEKKFERESSQNLVSKAPFLKILAFFKFINKNADLSQLKNMPSGGSFLYIVFCIVKFYSSFHLWHRQIKT